LSNEKEIKQKNVHIVTNEEVDFKMKKNKSGNNYSIEYFFDNNGIDIDDYIELKCMEIINNFNGR
jgi:hypothetical protein